MEVAASKWTLGFTRATVDFAPRRSVLQRFAAFRSDVEFVERAAWRGLSPQFTTVELVCHPGRNSRHHSGCGDA